MIEYDIKKTVRKTLRAVVLQRDGALQNYSMLQLKALVCSFLRALSVSEKVLPFSLTVRQICSPYVCRKCLLLFTNICIRRSCTIVPSILWLLYSLVELMHETILSLQFVHYILYIQRSSCIERTFK